jgi:kynurenine formamidase
MTSSSSRQIIDLSHALSEDTPAFPGDPSLQITILDSATAASTAGERHLNCSHLSMSLHCGTHMDAPFHFFQNAATIDQIPLDCAIGPALLIRLPYEVHGPTIEVRHVAPYESHLRATRRVIFNTAWHHRWGADNYFSGHPVITGPAAQWLVERGVQLVGVDTPSVDRPPFEAHLALLGAGLVIVENLTNLDAIKSDIFQFIATPLRIRGRDGSPVRAIALDE